MRTSFGKNEPTPQGAVGLAVKAAEPRFNGPLAQFKAAEPRFKVQRSRFSDLKVQSDPRVDDKVAERL